VQLAETEDQFQTGNGQTVAYRVLQVGADGEEQTLITALPPGTQVAQVCSHAVKESLGTCMHQLQRSRGWVFCAQWHQRAALFCRLYCRVRSVVAAVKEQEMVHSHTYRARVLETRIQLAKSNPRVVSDIPISLFPPTADIRISLLPIHLVVWHLLPNYSIYPSQHAVMPKWWVSLQIMPGWKPNKNNRRQHYNENKTIPL